MAGTESMHYSYSLIVFVAHSILWYMYNSQWMVIGYYHHHMITHVRYGQHAIIH
jgi:hypothetical protein